VSSPPAPTAQREPRVAKVASAVASSADVPDLLDWQTFCAAYFPGRRRHDFEALTEYGAYRRSRAADEQSSEEVVRTREATNGAAGSTALQGWEDEGGAAL
jgi:hypothetical protein